MFQELDNIYGMFRTRAILHQKAYKHKTIKAVEGMYVLKFVATNVMDAMHDASNKLLCRIADAIIEVKDLPLVQILKSETLR